MEKPTKRRAINYLKAGNYLWNAGIFVWRTSAIRDSLNLFAPRIVADFQEVEKKLGSSQLASKVRQAFSKCEDVSIDYAVMEKAKNVWVIPGDFGWSDLGSWSAVHDLSKKDKRGNVILANAIIENSSNSIVVGEKSRLIIADGLRDYMIADYGNGLLICKKDDEKKIREFVKRIGKEKGKDFI